MTNTLTTIEFKNVSRNVYVWADDINTADTNIQDEKIENPCHELSLMHFPHPSGDDSHRQHYQLKGFWVSAYRWTDKAPGTRIQGMRTIFVHSLSYTQRIYSVFR